VIYVVLFCLLVYGGVIGVNRYFGSKALAAMASAPPPAASVATTQARTEHWPEQIDAVATLEAFQGAQLTAQTSGIVTQVLFKSGETAKQRQLLVQLNDNTAKAQLAKDQAALTNASIQLRRQRTLLAKKATSQENEQSANASFLEAQAAVQADQAQLDNLQIRAPFDGHLGLRSVSPGEYVAAGSGVVDIQQWNPLRVVFNVPQQDLPRLALGDPLQLSVSGYPGRSFNGTLSAIGAAVDTSTGSVRVEAHIDNPDRLLRPGMFGQVHVHLANSRQVVAVPRTAIAYNTYGEYVYVVEKDKQGDVAQHRLVHVGVEHGDLVQIEDGIKPGEQVVVSGQVKLYPNAPIEVVRDPALASAVDMETH
jgi:membrane fusion protein (multidrug efflux system)